MNQFLMHSPTQCMITGILQNIYNNLSPIYPTLSTLQFFIPTREASWTLYFMDGEEPSRGPTTRGSEGGTPGIPAMNFSNDRLEPSVRHFSSLKSHSFLSPELRGIVWQRRIVASWKINRNCRERIGRSKLFAFSS